MRKDLGIIILKVGALSLVGVWSFGFEIAHAQERGIGVTPAKIEIPENVEWPYTIGIRVTNFSSETENFEVVIAKSLRAQDFSVGVDPGRFELTSGQSRRVLLIFEEPRKTTDGVVKIVSMKTSLEGFTTGTGVKIPFRIEKTGNVKFLAGVGEAFGDVEFHWLLGNGMILATLFLLWQIAAMTRPWILSSSKQ